MTRPAQIGAAAVIIGNEVLSAKVQERNGAWLIQRLREKGIPLRMLTVVPDEVDAIVQAIAHARAVAPYVITSGGIGPTHDDVTVRAVALALGRAVERLPRMVELIEQHFGEKLTAEALRLAEAPAGSELLMLEEAWYPVLSCEGIYMLPGVPQLFQIQLEAVLRRLPGEPRYLRILYLDAGEAQIASVLDEVARGAPDVDIGSYPEFDRTVPYRVRVTVEAASSDRVAHVMELLQAGLPPGVVLRTE